MAADVLATQKARSSAAIVLTKCDNYAHEFHEKGFQTTVPRHY